MLSAGDIRAGLEERSSARTITEADVMAFAGVSGDFAPLHVDEPWVREQTPFRGRIAHGLLVLSITSGLRSAFDAWEVLAYLEVERRFVAPVYPGDTIHARVRVEDVRPSASRPGTGVVTTAVEVVNQDDEVVQTGRDTLLVAGISDSRGGSRR